MKVVDVPEEMTDKVKTMSLEDARQLYNFYDQHKRTPTKLDENLGFGATVAASLQQQEHFFQTVPEAGEIFSGMQKIRYGNAIKKFSENIGDNSLLSSIGNAMGTIVRTSGEELVKVANRNLEVKREQQEREAIPLSKEERESMTLRVLSGTGDTAFSVAVSMVPFLGPALSSAYIGTKAFTAAQLDSIESYKKEHPEDKELTGYFEKADEETRRVALKTIVSLATENLPIGRIGLGRGFRKMLQEGRALKQLIKSGKAAPLSIAGIAGKAGMNFLKSGGSEAGEEILEGLGYMAIDSDKIKTIEDALGMVEDTLKDAVAAFLNAGPLGSAVYVSSRASAISTVRSALSGSMSEQDAAHVASIVVDNQIKAMKDVTQIAIQTSSEFAQKRGEIYDRFSAEVAKAARESGAYTDLSEEEFSQFIASESRRFADQIGGLAIQRKQLIPQVLDANKIVYKDGELFLEGVKEGKNTQVYNRLMQESMDIAQENSRLDAQYPEYKGETIDIGGVQKTVYNSSGERIAKSAEALKNFYNWFGDSKVVDDKGRPLVVYHGTPNKIYDILKPGTHFTADKEYADVYQKQGASSAGYKKEAVKPGTYAVYLRMENPFDTRQEKAREDFYKYYYQQMGMGTDLTEKGLPDWNDGRDLLDFITEYHPELGYDGIILDEGGTGGYGQEVKDRGISYVVKESNQIKATDNRGTYSLTDENIYNQFEEIGNKTKFTKSEYDLKKLMQTFPPRQEFRLMYDKGKGYWFVADSMEQVHSDIMRTAYRSGLYPEFKSESEAMDYYNDKTYQDDGSLVRFIAFGYENNNYMDRIDQMADDYTRAYIIDNGNGNGVILFARYESDLDDANIGYLSENAKLYDTVNKRFLDQNTYNQETEGVKDLYVQHNTTAQKLEDALELGALPMPSLAVTKKESGDIGFGNITFVGGRNIIDPNWHPGAKTYAADIYSTRRVTPVYEISKEGKERIGRIIEGKTSDSLYQYVSNLEDGLSRNNDTKLRELFLLDRGLLETADDWYKTSQAIDKMTESQNEDYRRWKRRFSDEYFNKEIFEGYTPSGNRKYSEYNLNNVLKNMKQEAHRGSEGFSQGNSHALRGMWAKEMSSISEIKNNEFRLVGEEDYRKANEQLELALDDVVDKVVDEKTNEYLESIGESYDKEGFVVEVLKDVKKSNVQKVLSENHLKSDKEAVKAVVAFKELVEMLPVRYFESKPTRAVDFSEFDAVYIPSDSKYDYIAKEMQGRGLDVERYSNNEEKQQKIKQRENIFFQKQKKISKGQYDAAKKAIKLFKSADTSTISHELAHYYLDNMWNYVLSGVASKEYLNNFIAVRDFLGITPNQNRLTRRQHEKFASAYEKYIHRGIVPASPLGTVFDNYDKWLKRVYKDINDIKAQGTESFELTPEIIQFFDNMTTGELMTPVESATIAEVATTTSVKEADDKTVKEAKEVVKEIPVKEPKPELDVKPLDTDGKQKESRYFARVKEATEIDGKMDYTVVDLDEQRKKATEMWNKDPTRAENILNGTVQADDILRSALYTEQQRLALERGDRATFEASVRKQSAEATRMGQELSALRGVVEDITMPAYWLRYAENEAMKQLAKQMTPVFNRHLDKSVLQQLTSQLDADIKELYNKVNSLEAGKEKANALKEGITELKKKYKGLEQPDMVFNQTGYEEMTQEYVEKKTKEAIGIYMSDSMVDEIIQKARDLDALSNQVDPLGLPTSAFFAKKAELEATVNRHTPTSQVKVALSIIGRSNMLTAPATTVLNVTTNATNYATQLELRRITNKVSGHTNDNIIDEGLQKQYRQKAWKVFWDTGYDISMLSDLTDTRLYKGESITHSEGDGVIRAVGRFAEKWVFSRLISAPDVYFKSMKAFTEFAGNEATEIAYKEGLSGEKAKARATEIFKDAILVEPQTEQGKSVRQKAQVDALVVTFQQDTELSKNLLKLREWINKSTGDIGIGDILSPFVKTPTNILSMGFDATIGPFASPRNLIAAYNDIRRGQMNTLPVQQAVKQTSFAAIAYTVMAMLVSAFIDDDDYIPDYSQLTQAERNAVKEAGGSFGSVLLGNTYVSTDFFGPFEMPLVAILNSRRYGSVLKGLSATTLHQLLNAPVLKDFSETTEQLKSIGEGQIGILEAVYDGVTNAVITRAVPNVLNVIAKATDDYERETNKSAINKLKAKVPFLRQTLPEKVSKATGKKVETQPVALQMLLGARGHIKVENRLANELKRLSETGQGASLSDITRSGDLKSVPEENKHSINAEFAKEYSKLAGALVRSPEYKSKTDEEKKKALNKVRDSVVRSLKIKYQKYIKKRLKK